MDTLRKTHMGRNVERIRELKGMKQDTLASILGLSQQTVSRIEQSETIEEDRLAEIAKALGVSSDTIRNYNDELVTFHIQNMHDNASANYQYHFNPIDKVVELYERLLDSERNKVKQLEDLVKTLQQKDGNG